MRFVNSAVPVAFATLVLTAAAVCRVCFSLHSASFLETHKVRGAIIVSAYHSDLGDRQERESGYFGRPWQWDAIAANAGFLVQYHSVDDVRASASATGGFSLGGILMSALFPETFVCRLLLTTASRAGRRGAPRRRSDARRVRRVRQSRSLYGAHLSRAAGGAARQGGRGRKGAQIIEREQAITCGNQLSGSSLKSHRNVRSGQPGVVGVEQTKVSLRRKSQN